MKRKHTSIPAASKLNLRQQVGNLFPESLVSKLARERGGRDKARTFKPWSHMSALMYAQLTHRIGLNDLCDALSLHSGHFRASAGPLPPNRNTLSHANKVRPAQKAENLFWAELDYLSQLSPRFVSGKAVSRILIPEGGEIQGNFFRESRHRLALAAQKTSTPSHKRS
jgi:hypothetical protein